MWGASGIENILSKRMDSAHTCETTAWAYSQRWSATVLWNSPIYIKQVMRTNKTSNPSDENTRNARLSSNVGANTEKNQLNSSRLSFVSLFAKKTIAVFVSEYRQTHKYTKCSLCTPVKFVISQRSLCLRTFHRSRPLIKNKQNNKQQCCLH